MSIYIRPFYFVHVQGHCVLEMPCGTGKTVSLLSLIVAYQLVCALIMGNDWAYLLVMCIIIYVGVSS